MKTKTAKSVKKSAQFYLGISAVAVVLVSLFFYGTILHKAVSLAFGGVSAPTTTASKAETAATLGQKSTAVNPNSPSTQENPPPSAPTSTNVAPKSVKPSPSATPPKATAAPPPAPVSQASSDIAPVSACPSQADVTAAQTVIACMASYARVQHGASAVTSNSALIAAAAAKAQDIINCGFSHTACGQASNYWIKTKGYLGKCTGENIAQGQQTPLAVFTAWMNSAGHRANILNPSYNHIGVATAGSGSGLAWVMELGGC